MKRCHGPIEYWKLPEEARCFINEFFPIRPMSRVKQHRRTVRTGHWFWTKTHIVTVYKDGIMWDNRPVLLPLNELACAAAYEKAQKYQLGFTESEFFRLIATYLRTGNWEYVPGTEREVEAWNQYKKAYSALNYEEK